MRLGRRKFLGTAGSASLLALAGCQEGPALGLFPPKRPASGAFESPAGPSRDLVSHVIARLSYGPVPGGHGRVKAMGVEAYIDEQLAPEAIDDRYCDWKIRRFQTIRYPAGELFEYRERLVLDDVTRATLLRAVYSRRQLHEVMVNFWTDHFNIDTSKGDCRWLKSADDREVVRRHALGKFPDLLRASALSPAMLWYLDGRENRKAKEEDRPNENYAREVLELHTLGARGGYTQQDIMETARCLTGWTVRSREKFGKGKVEFRARNHDDGAKFVLGRHIPAGQGAKDLDTVLQLAAGHPSTARHIAAKLCRRFISERPAQASVDAVARTFAQTEGDIKQALRVLFATDEFRAVRDTKFQRPFRFVVSSLRAAGAETDAGGGVLEYLLRMGQPPFQCPTPDGYPEEQAPWLGALLWRWHFAAALAENRIKGVKVDWRALAERAGGGEGVMAHVLGRTPTPAERQAIRASGLGVALLLASPAFQRY